MQVVEQTMINKSDPRYAIIDVASFASKNLYNLALYEVRQSFLCPDGGGVTHPFPIGKFGLKIPVEEIGSGSCPIAPFGAHGLIAPAFGCEIHLTHQAGCPFSRTTKAEIAQFSLDARTSIDPSFGMKNA